MLSYQQQYLKAVYYTLFVMIGNAHLMLRDLG